jgi:hypothetical protein
MRLLRLRRLARTVSVLLMAATAIGLPHLAQDDRACVPAADGYVDHDASKHGLGPGGKAEQDHCAVCHFTRSLRSPRAVVAATVAPVPAHVAFHHPVALTLLPPALDLLPARAPPASASL